MSLEEIIFEIMRYSEFWTVTEIHERVLSSKPLIKRPDIFAAMRQMVVNDELLKLPIGKDSFYRLKNYDPNDKFKKEVETPELSSDVPTDIPAEFNRHDEVLRQIELRKEDQQKAVAHYQFSYKGHKIDPYRIFRIYNIAAPEQQHAIKKLLRAGKSVKTLNQDIDEVILTLQRWKEILKEDIKLN